MKNEPTAELAAALAPEASETTSSTPTATSSAIQETAPAADNETAPEITTSGTNTAPDSPPDESGTMGALPAEYLCNGYFKGEGKGRYADPDLVGPTAEELAKALAEGGLKQAGYNPILRELKKANKKTLPLEAKVGALAGAMVKAKLLEQRKRAPHLLAEVLERNRTAVQNTADPDVYRVAYQHLEAVGAYLGDIQ